MPFARDGFAPAGGWCAFSTFLNRTMDQIADAIRGLPQMADVFPSEGGKC